MSRRTPASFTKLAALALWNHLGRTAGTCLASTGHRRALAALICVISLSHIAVAEQSAPQHLTLALPTADAAPRTIRPVEQPHGEVSLLRTFLDEFPEFEPNTGPWRHRFEHAPTDVFRSRTLVNNDEQQIYVDPMFTGTSPEPLGLNPFSTRNGVLEITGSVADTGTAQFLGTYRHISGMLMTQGRFEQRYGYFEARMRLPGGQGIWPAFWLKTSRAYAPEGRPAWPPEIDVMEYIGGPGNWYSTTVHWDVMPNNKKSGLRIPIEDPTGRFHTFGVFWGPEQTVFYLDREPVSAIETKFNHHTPMYMIINLALGGRWPGPIDNGALPATLEIDWVAAYQIDP